MLSGIVKVDLVSANAEAADNDKILGFLQDFGGELGLRSYSYHMYVS